MSRGIYLVANRHSQREAAQLVSSLRLAGCKLPIVLIPFDDDAPTHPRLAAETTRMDPAAFPDEGRELLRQIAGLWPSSRAGLFRRLLAWWGPFDEFIYADNDIVALADWTRFFDYLGDNHFLHGDLEVKTGGKYAYERPEKVVEAFGPHALDSLFTTGHFASRRSPGITTAFFQTVEWLRANPGVAWKVDGPFLHLAVLVGGLRIRNLCAPPDDFPSPWAGDYRNTVELIQTIQRGKPLFQLHYSGGAPDGYEPIHDPYFSDATDAERMRHFLRAAAARWSGWHYWKNRAWPGMKRRLKGG